VEHFGNPPHHGVIEDADGVGEMGNPLGSDLMTFYLKVKDDVFEAIKERARGAVASIRKPSLPSPQAPHPTRINVGATRWVAPFSRQSSFRLGPGEFFVIFVGDSLALPIN
jgi:NifU-like N terminal domain